MLVSEGGILFGKLFGPHVELFGSVYGLENVYPIYDDKGISGHAVRVQMHFTSKHRDCVTIFLCDKMGHIKWPVWASVYCFPCS